MKALKNKMGKNGGFTLVEMLIVVAIIAILVAVSIPIINTSLEKARDATDDANLRAAKAEGAIIYLSTEGTFTAKGYLYDAEKGELRTTAMTADDAYGRCTGSGTGCVNHTEQVVGVYITADGKVSAGWTNPTTVPTAAFS